MMEDKNVTDQSLAEICDKDMEGQPGMFADLCNEGQQQSDTIELLTRYVEEGQPPEVHRLLFGSEPPTELETDGRGSVEKDSPTKRLEEFELLIGETEASMRNKLSSLTLPDPDGLRQEDDTNVPVTIDTEVPVTIDTKVSVTIDTKTGNQDENEKVITNNPIAIETETNTDDVVKLTNASDSPDSVDLVTEVASVQDDNRDDVLFQPTIINVVSKASGEIDTVDNVRSGKMISSKDVGDTEDLNCNESEENDDNRDLQDTVTEKESEGMKDSQRVEEIHVGISKSVNRTAESTGPDVISDVGTDINQAEVSAGVEKDKVLMEKKCQVNETSKQAITVNDENQINNEQLDKTNMKNDEDVLKINEADPSTVLEAVNAYASSRQETGSVDMIDITDNVSYKVQNVTDNEDVVGVSDSSVNNQSVVEQQDKEIDPVSERAGYDDGMDSESELIIDETEKSIKESNDEITEGNDRKEDNEEVASGESKSGDSDESTEENLMIIDVRSLTDNSEINNFDDKSKNVAKENKALSHEKEGTTIKSSEEVNKDSRSVEKPHSFSSSKSKRKSPNSVRRITEPIDSSESLQPEVSESNIPLIKSTTTCSSVETSRNAAKESSIQALSQSNSVAPSSVSESLPIISNTFSMRDISQSDIRVKDEPPDDGMYGVMQSYGNIPQMYHPTIASFQQTSMNLVPGNAIIHKGQVLSQGIANQQKLGRPPNVTHTLVISKVPPIVCPTIAGVSLVSSTPASVIGNPMSTVVSQTGVKVQSVSQSKGSGAGKTAPIITLRNLAPKSAVPATAQNGNTSTATASSKDKTKEPTTKNLSTINIHSVGVARITDLIARKNPIPTFKPDPIPDYMKSVQSTKVYPCYECGDSFHFAKSFRQHLGRCSMNIFYKCEKCRKKIKFTNKCQLLNHLRSHLNIDKTQAVPIHIKSDSIEIVTNFNAISADTPFEWYKEVNTSNITNAIYDQTSVPEFHCMDCSKIFSTKSLLVNHVKGSINDQYFCEECPIYLNSKCALQAHTKLHKLEEVKSYKSPNVNEWKLLRNLSCPECGEDFWRKYRNGHSYINGFLSEMAVHLKNVCFHLSRLPAYKCTKCMKVFQNYEGLRDHMNTRLEHYYKCGLCPMALKSLKSLESHYDMKHKMSDNTTATPGMSDKIIYRCHICDTLIDDKSFLVQHIDKHLEECKKHPETHYHCLQCGQMFMQRNDLLTHSSRHSTVRRQFWCTFCSKDQVKATRYINHMLLNHTSTRSHLASRSVVRFCNQCGLVCVGEHMFQNHACLAARNTQVIVGDRPEQKASTKTKPQGKKETSSLKETVPKDDLPANVSSTCFACSAVFYSLAQRESHLKDHRDYDKIFICKYCDQRNFKSYHELRSHEIACKAMSEMPKEKRKGKQNGVQVKDGTVPNRKIRSKADLQRKRSSSIDMENDSYVDGVELTPKETSKSKHEGETVEYHLCNKCDAVFTRKSKQEEHIKSEHGIHPCHLCGLMHESQSSLRKHLMVDHEGKRMLLYCGICKSRKIDKAFNLRGKLIKHLKVKHRMKVIDESKIITQLPGLPETMTETNPEGQKRKLSMSPETSVKKLRIEGESDFKCAKCLFTCNVKSEFRLHILDHKAAETYQCLECGLCFAVLPSLRKHVFMVHKVKDFDSYMAENEIEEPTALEDKDVDIIREPEPTKSEVMEESSEEEASGDPLECKVCYRSFDNENVLKSHMRTHGMAFIKKSRRRAHNSSLAKKAENEVAYSSSQDDGKHDGLVIKLKRLKTINDDKDDLKIVDVTSLDDDDVTEMEVDVEEVKQTESVEGTPENLK